MKVVLAEKPKQAIEYAKSFDSYVTKNGEGYIEAKDKGETIYITWAVGHLLEIPKPAYYGEQYKNFNFGNLPFFPEIEFHVKEDVKKQYEAVVKLLHKATTVILATDPDREGEFIAWSVLETVEGYEKKEIKRLWINSLDPNVIRKGFENLHDAKDYYNHFLEAKVRSISDYLIGMNHSQLYTLLLKEKGINETFSVGRVQSPCLYIIYEREMAIQNFVPKTNYSPKIILNKHDLQLELTTSTKFETKAAYNEKLASYGEQVFKNTLKEVKIQKTKESAPKLFSMSTLQTYLNSLFNLSPSEVLETAQKLYEKKYTSYPRSACNYITTAEYDYLKKSFNGYCDFLNLELGINIEEHTPNSKYIANDKVLEHYAIIPTQKIITSDEFQKLTDVEKIVYREILMRTVLTFMPPHEYNKTTVTVELQGIVFTATGKEILINSWKAFKTNDGDVLLPPLSTGEILDMKLIMREIETQKPRRLREGNLITIMKYASKRLNDDEIDALESDNDDENKIEDTITTKFEVGTEATRADIIKTLKNRQYTELIKNQIHLTPKGEILAKSIEGTLLSSVEMTAKWEAVLSKIGKGERKPEEFITNIKKFIVKLIEEAPAIVDKNIISEQIEAFTNVDAVGECPLCKSGHIVKVRNQDFYGCSDKGCKQTFSSNYLKKKLSEAQLKKLLKNGKTDLIKGFVGKSEKPFDATLTLELRNERYNYQLNFKTKK